jgi:uncharacterized protein with HEPN domain
MSRDDATLLDIREAVRRIVEFGAGATAAELRDDARTLSAVLYQITVLGEAVKRLSQEFRDAHPDVPWKRTAGMRDRVIHDYDRVNVEVVAEVINDSAPALLEQIDRLIP